MCVDLCWLPGTSFGAAPLRPSFSLAFTSISHLQISSFFFFLATQGNLSHLAKWHLCCNFWVLYEFILSWASSTTALCD